MQGWWRVLRGVKPYWRQVVVSMICAIGVGLSYASGVAVLMPVMKIFISNEGVHGWADRSAAEKRLNVEILNLDGTVSRTEKKSDTGHLGLIITSVGAASPAKDNTPDEAGPAILKPDGGVEKCIIRVQGVVEGKTWESSRWFGTKDRLGMVDILAKADSGKPVLVDVEGRNSTDKDVPLKLRDLRFYNRRTETGTDLVFQNIRRRRDPGELHTE